MSPHSWVQADLSERGPLIDVTLSPVPDVLAAARAAGEQVPDPVTVRALVDTGSGTTAIDEAVARKLRLRPVGSRLIVTPSSADPVQKPAYAVQFLLPGNSAWFEGTVTEALLAVQGVDMIIGRNILSHAVFVYVGSTGHCTLSF